MNDQSLEEDYDSLSVDLVTSFPSVSSLSAIDCLTSRASYFFLDAAEVSVCPLFSSLTVSARSYLIQGMNGLILTT